MIPTNIRVPFFFIEFDPSNAAQGSSQLEYKVLIIGQMLSTGTMYKDVAAVGPVLATNADTVGKYFGKGSQVHCMAEAYFKNNQVTRTYFVGLRDNGTNKAKGTFSFIGSATSAGTVFAYVNGTQIQVPVSVGDTAATVATALASRLPDTSPVTAEALNGTVTFTAKNAGTKGNSIDLRVNVNPGEEIPAGLALTITAMSGGATDPSLDDALALLGDAWYHVIIGPYTDATNLTIIETELASRFSSLRQIDGIYVTSLRGTLSDLSTFGQTRNSPHVTCLHFGGVSGKGGPSWDVEVAAAYGAQIAQEGSVDPARPLKTLELKGILPPAVEERFTMMENNSLLYDGVSTFEVDEAGKVRIQRAITMYRKNDAGAVDTAYLDITTMLTLMYLRYDFRNTILRKYPRAKLADDGVYTAPGQQVMTPKRGKAEAISIFQNWQEKMLVENLDQFKRDLVCQRSKDDPNRLEWLLPPDLINQFLIGAANIQFRL